MIRQAFSALLLGVALAAPLQAQVDPELLAGIKARSIGPAGMSGRVAAVAAVASNPNIIYVGSATGGLWKSIDGGLTWEPLFDEQPVASIGAVAIFEDSPDIVWVGTGEGNPRNSASVGNGIYKSMDGGRNWTHLGLDKTEKIHRIFLHPNDPNVAYVGALGTTWGENPERGVFKTEDGGATWQKVLYVDERTGAADLEMDPTNPNKLIAAMWDHRRWPWSFRSGGPGSGIYMTVDGARTWTKLSEDDGLPAGELGRVGLAIAPSDPNIVYALVEAKENALYKSEDGGYSWRKTGAQRRFGNRPFYYADLRVDPADPKRVYSLWSRVSVSDDGGESFEQLPTSRIVHPDHHAMWINPNDPNFIIEGNDGGVYISRDRGETWRFASNLPLAQYYHINVDMKTPYNVYGGMQDNGSWRGPSSVWENGGIRNHHWEEVGFGDGFATLAVPSDALTGYAMSQEGFLRRWDLRTGERKDIRPAGPDGEDLRFNWNAAIAIDPLDGNTVYYGSQFVHKSTDRGETWTIISQDLTTDNPEWQKQAESGGLTLDVTGAENFTAIVTIAPSAVEQGVIWVGTDDGRVHVTRDGGATWTSVESNIRGVPDNTWVPHIEPSKYDSGEAFIVFDDHRRSNWAPYVFKTTDYGRRWTSLATDDLWGYALVIEQDPVDRDLLFLGTEFGLYVSLDGGQGWMKWTHGFPTVSAMAMTVHPREHDLVVGTHGRAAFVIDDIRPLRSISPETLAESVHLFEIPDAQQYRVKQTGASRFPANTEFRGENRPYGALITYSLNIEGLPRPDEEGAGEGRGARRRDQGGGDADNGEGVAEVTIEITDESGDVIRTFDGPAKLGVNRTAWDLRRDEFKRPRNPERSFFFQRGGPEVLPGAYGVRIKYGEHEASGSVRVLADPRFDIPQGERVAKFEAIMRAGALQEVVADAVARIKETRADVDEVLAKARNAEAETNIAGTNGDATNGDSPNEELIAAGRALKNNLKDMEKRLWNPPSTKGIVADTDVLSKISFPARSMSSSWDAPTPAQEAYLARAEAMLQEVISDFNMLFNDDVAEFRAQVETAGIQFLKPKAALEMPGE